jgi:hypothetical protein
MSAMQKVAHKQAQNHHAETSKTDKDDIDSCVQHTFEHQYDHSKHD